MGRVGEAGSRAFTKETTKITDDNDFFFENAGISGKTRNDHVQNCDQLCLNM